MKSHPTKKETPARRSRKSLRNTVYAFNRAENHLRKKAARKARRENLLEENL